jgi:glycosyltransferase involved in cell wall biosynthesis
MNVVIVDGDVSYPPTSGKRLRTLHLMLRLAGRHRITYIARCNGGPEEAREATAYLEDHGIHTIAVEQPVARKKGLSFYVRLAGNLLSSLPYSVASHSSPQMRQVVQGHAARNRVDLWQFEWSPYLAMLPDPAARKVLIAHNVDTLIWQRYHETETSTLRRWYVKQQWRKFEHFERWAFRTATRVVAVSPEDARLVREQFGVESVDVVDNGVDTAYFESVTPVPNSQRILFLGSLEWRPNLDGVRLLLDEVYPAVRAREPAASFVIVGRKPPSWLRERVRNLPGVELHADVPDVRPFLADSAVLAVPLRIGGGSRLKILEALACGLPVVSTRVGAEGLCLRPGQEYVLADSSDDMADALVECLHNPEKARAMAQSGRTFVREQYDWQRLADKLERVWEKCVDQSLVMGAAKPHAAAVAQPRSGVAGSLADVHR